MPSTMPSFTPLRRTYSALSSSLSSSDDIHSGDTKKIVVQSKKSGPRTIPRHSFLIRVIVFVLLESSFIALVSVALRRPIILHLSFKITEVKSVVTATAIIWHAVAVYVVKDILLNIFSAEWIEQHNGSRSLTLQELDIASRLTSGFIDQARHCVSDRATHAFRLSFLSFLLLILLNGLGPSAIGIDLTSYDYPSTVQVAKLTIGVPDKKAAELLAIHRANSVIQLEMVQNSTTLGFSSTQPNILIPWPSSDSMSEDMTMRYQSDVIRYNFSCTWNIPSPPTLSTGGNWIAADNNWGALFDGVHSQLTTLVDSCESVSS
jgi:hypothetical protein